MKRTSKLFFSFVLLFGFSTLIQAETSTNKNFEFLVNRLSKNDRRFASFLLVLELLEHRQAKNLVETGTARCGDRNFEGDGGSTIIFSHWASKNGAHLFTVDNSQEAIENARISTQKYGNNVQFFCCDSIEFLRQFNQKIDFLYLDSFDYDFNNPNPSQAHHLNEAMAAYHKLHEKSIVMVDDCDLPSGGKGKLLIEFLLKKGWTVIYKGYQTILVQ